MPKKISRLSEQKVRQVTSRIASMAQIVIELFPDGSVETRWNPDPQIYLLVVIGPGRAWDYDYPRAILCEIGLHRTRPYRQAYAIGSGADRMNTRQRPVVIPKRTKKFFLTNEQYLRVAPAIFAALQDWADLCVAPWKNRTFALPRQRLYYLRKGRWIHESVTIREWKRGIRVHVSALDELLLADFYAAEAQLNIQRQDWRVSIAKRLGMMLADTRDARVKPLDQLKPFTNAVDFLTRSSYPRHLIFGLGSTLRERLRKEIFSKLLSRVFNGDLRYYQEMSRWEGRALAGLKERVGELQVFYVPERESVDGALHTGVTFELWAHPELYVNTRPKPPEGDVDERELASTEEATNSPGLNFDPDEEIPF